MNRKFCHSFELAFELDSWGGPSSRAEIYYSILQNSLLIDEFRNIHVKLVEMNVIKSILNTQSVSSFPRRRLTWSETWHDNMTISQHRSHITFMSNNDHSTELDRKYIRLMCVRVPNIHLQLRKQRIFQLCLIISFNFEVNYSSKIKRNRSKKNSWEAQWQSLKVLCWLMWIREVRK